MIERAGAKLQWRLQVRDIGELLDFLISPIYALIFLSIIVSSGRSEFIGYAVLAPGLISLWSRTVNAAGEIVGVDRWFGVLELLTASPAPVFRLIAGRIALVTAVSLVSFLESLVVAKVGFGLTIVVHDPLVFGLTIIAAAMSSGLSALLVAALFLLARDARTLQNAISYPIFVLGGVIVPTALLPGAFEPISRAVYLSWASDLLRDTLSPTPVPNAAIRICIVLGLGLATGALGIVTLRRVFMRLRETGRISVR